MWIVWLPAGVILAIIFIRVARTLNEPKVFAIVLIVAALIYVGFAVFGDATGGRVALEILGVILYGTAAVLGLRVNPWWLAIGWGAHPVWDAGLQLMGGGHEYVPSWYAISCISFDAVLALYIAYQCSRPGPDNSFKPTSLRNTASFRR